MNEGEDVLMRKGTLTRGFAGVAATALAQVRIATRRAAANAAPPPPTAYSLKVIDTEDWSGADEVFPEERFDSHRGPRSLNTDKPERCDIPVASGTIISAWDEDAVEPTPTTGSARTPSTEPEPSSIKATMRTTKCTLRSVCQRIPARPVADRH